MTGPRLTPIEIRNLRLLPGCGSLKAFADVALGNVMVLHGCRIIQQENQRPYCALPQTPARKKSDGSGAGWFPLITDMYPPLLERLREAVLEAFEAKLQPAPTIGSKAARDARIAELSDQFEPDQDIPF